MSLLFTCGFPRSNYAVLNNGMVIRITRGDWWGKNKKRNWKPAGVGKSLEVIKCLEKFIKV